jgi:hypothetical protein
MKEVIFNTPWGVMRWLRLIIAVVLIVNVIIKFDVLLALFGGILMYQALFNAGCEAGACAAPAKVKKPAKEDDYVEFEEVK